MRVSTGPLDCQQEICLSQAMSADCVVSQQLLVSAVGFEPPGLNIC